MLNPFDRLGDILVSLGYIDRDTLEKFIFETRESTLSKTDIHASIKDLVTEDRGRYLAAYKSHFLGENLVQAHLITRKQLKKALEMQENLKLDFPNIPKSKIIFISEIIHKISRSKNVYGIINLIMEYCNKVVDAKASTLFLHNKEKNTLTFYITTGEERDFLIEREIPVNEGIAGWVFQNNQSALINDVSSDERFCSKFDKASGFHTKNIICVPIRVNYKAVGALETINKADNKPFKQKDESLLNILANQIGVHMENRMFIQELKYSAYQVETFNYKELKKNKQLSEKGVEALQKTFKETIELCMRAKHLTSSLLRLGKREVIKKESVNIESFLLEVIKPLEGQFSTRGIHLKKVFLSKVSSITLDKGHFSDLITNIAINALQAIEDRQLRLRAIHQNPEMSLTINVNQKDNFLVLEFIDTGIGIPPSDIEKVFDPFFSTKQQTIEKGTGLGLTMVRRIVDLHNGSININSITQEMIDSDPKTYSEKQCGTTITVQIPIVKTEQDQI